MIQGSCDLNFKDSDYKDLYDKILENPDNILDCKISDLALTKLATDLSKTETFNKDNEKTIFVARFFVASTYALKKIEDENEKKAIIERLKKINFPDVTKLWKPRGFCKKHKQQYIPYLPQSAKTKDVIEVMQKYDVIEVMQKYFDAKKMDKEVTIKGSPFISKENEESKIACVIHVCSFDNLISLLRMGKLIPGISGLLPWIDSGCGGEPNHECESLFMSVLPSLFKEKFEQGEFEKLFKEKLFKDYFKPKDQLAMMVFSKKVLQNRKDYHFTFGWDHGNFDQNKSLKAEDIGELEKKGALEIIKDNNELVFKEPVNLDNLKEIWVSSEDKEKELLKKLKENKITTNNLVRQTNYEAFYKKPEL